jgi:hypothetical protein
MSSTRAVAAAVVLALFSLRVATADVGAPPARLSGTGLYVAPGVAAVDPANLPYTPQYPLWTDGAVKSRWIRLPEGTTIDAHDDTAWDFPVGTKLWKEFAFAGRKVETRLVWRVSEDEWVFAAYVWNEEQTDAVLAPDRGVARAADLGEGRYHAVPSVSDCRACHEAGPTRVLGFNALQLSDDRDSGAPHAEPLLPGMVTNRTLVDEHRLVPPRPDLAEHPPTIRASNPIERAALGYLTSNCGTCHNPTGALASLGFVLSHDPRSDAPEPGLLTTFDRPGHWIVPGTTPGESHVVTPGSPETSSLAVRMRSRRPTSRMPPLGTVLSDDDAIALIEAWISGLDQPLR